MEPDTTHNEEIDDFEFPEDFDWSDGELDLEP